MKKISRALLFSLAFCMALSSALAWTRGSNDAYSRFFLDPNGDGIGHNTVKQFTNLTDVCNSMGNGNRCTSATDFYAGWNTNGLLAYYTIERLCMAPCRAHLFSADINPLTLANLQAVRGEIKFTADDFVWDICVGPASYCTPNFPGLPVADVTTLASSATRFTDLKTLLNNTLATITPTIHANGVTNATVSPVTVPITFDSGPTGGTWIDITSASGALYPGALICTSSDPCLSSSSDYICQLDWEPAWAVDHVANSTGLWMCHVAPANITRPSRGNSAIAQYSIMTDTPAGPPFIALSRAIVGGTLPTDVYAEYCIANCGATNEQWVLNTKITVSSPTTYSIQAPSQATLSYTHTGPTATTQYIDFEHQGFAMFGGNNGASYYSFATGAGACSLGLCWNSVGLGGVPFTNSFVEVAFIQDSDPGADVLNTRNIVPGTGASPGYWQSCQLLSNQASLAPGLDVAINLGVLGAPHLQCPAGHAAFVGSISGGVLTATNVEGTIAIGDTLVDPGAGSATGFLQANTTIASSCGAGCWNVSPSQTVASEIMTATIPSYSWINSTSVGATPAAISYVPR